MKIFHFLTALLILLKVTNTIQISWLMVLAPSLITIALATLVMIACFVIAIIAD